MFLTDAFIRLYIEILSHFGFYSVHEYIILLGGEETRPVSFEAVSVYHVALDLLIVVPIQINHLSGQGRTIFFISQ